MLHAKVVRKSLAWCGHRPQCGSIQSESGWPGLILGVNSFAGLGKKCGFHFLSVVSSWRCSKNRQTVEVSWWEELLTGLVGSRVQGGNSMHLRSILGASTGSSCRKEALFMPQSKCIFKELPILALCVHLSGSPRCLRDCCEGFSLKKKN